MSEQIKPMIEEILHPFFQEHTGLELVDIEYVKEGNHWFLRVFVDKAGSIDIEDCGRISEFLSERLDEKDPIQETYFLEVSSPGAERPLKKPEDIYKAVNKNIFVTTYEPVDGLKEFEGLLLSFTENTLVIRVGIKKHSVPHSKVASARLAIIF